MAGTERLSIQTAKSLVTATREAIVSRPEITDVTFKFLIEDNFGNIMWLKQDSAGVVSIGINDNPVIFYDSI